MVGLNNDFNRPETHPASIPLPEVIGYRTERPSHTAR
jgi:hypothetical protein